MSNETLISVTADTPQLDALNSALKSTDGRRKINVRASGYLFRLVRKHLQGLAQNRHATASRLGATPTNYYAKAYASSTYSATADGAEVTVRAPGFRRVFGPLTVLPRNAQALSIPVHPLAYGKRVSDLKRDGVNVVRPKGASYLIKPNKDGSVELLYLLVRSVLIPQDRTMLPSDDALRAETRKGIKSGIKSILKKSEASA